MGAEVQKVEDKIEEVVEKKSQVNTEKGELEGERNTAQGELSNLDPTTDQDAYKSLVKKIEGLDKEILKLESEWNKLDFKEEDLELEELEKQAALDLYTDPDLSADMISQLETERDAAVATAEANLATSVEKLSTYMSELPLLEDAKAIAGEEFKKWQRQSPEERVFIAAHDARERKASALVSAEGVTQQKQTVYNTAVGDVAAAETALTNAKQALELVLDGFSCCDSK